MNKEKKPKEKYSYAFPNFLAQAMAKVDMRTQMESSMLSQFMLIIGLTIMVIYMIFSGQVGGFYKVLVIINLLAGWLLISSYLITTYQQYTSYMEAMKFDPDAEKAAMKRRGNIFKRIKMAIKNKREKKLRKKKIAMGIKVPDLVDDVLKNMDKIEEPESSGGCEMCDTSEKEKVTKDIF